MTEIEIIGKPIVTKFRSPTNHYTVAKFRLHELVEKDITITGYLPQLQMDCVYRLFGYYKEHPKYGMQFEIMRYELVLPSDESSIITYLSGPIFPGIGKKMATAIVNHLGNEALEKIKTNPGLLDIIRGMNEKKKQTIVEGISKNDNLDESIRFFTMHGISVRTIMKLDQIYGTEVIKTIKANPYQLIEDVDGIGFLTADKLARSMGFDQYSLERSKAALLALVMDLCMSTGDSYVLYGDLDKPLMKMLGHSEFDFDQILNYLLREKKLFQEQDRIYHMSQYEAENEIAKFFCDFMTKMTLDLDQDLIDRLIIDIEKQENIQYANKQKEAISLFARENFVVLTGGPGTGKSTIVKAMVKLYRKLYPHRQIALAAPTGRASKRLAELTDAEACTIHRLLRWNLETNTFGMNEESPLPFDLLIVDEFSMVDNWMLHQLLLASSQISKIVFIGDEDQLPSVACGSVLRDIIAANRFPVVRLQTIFRQQEGSGVVSLAHDLKQDMELRLESLSDVKFYETSLYDVKNTVLHIVERALEKGYDMSAIQVLAPKYSGQAGIDAMNHALQRLCNPESPFKQELQSGYRLFREGDKILQLKNQPDDDVYNGDIGILEEIILDVDDVDRKNRIIVNYDGILVEYTSELFSNITHAYCISIHKSQGSEYPIVIMPVVREHMFMLSKRLLYTGITRAKKSLILIGEYDTFLRGIHTLDRKERLTTLKHRIEACFSLHEKQIHGYPNCEE